MSFYLFKEPFKEGISSEELIRLKKENTLDSRTKIIEANIRFVKFLVEDFNCDFDQKEELFQVGLIGLIKAVDTFDIDKGFSFSTYAKKCIMNEISMYFRKNNKDENHLNDLNDFSDIDLEENYIEQEEKIIILKMIKDLPEREKEIILMYFGFYGKLYTQLEIANKFGIGQSYVSRLIKSIIVKFRKEIGDYQVNKKRKSTR